MPRLVLAFLIFIGVTLVLTIGIFLWSDEPAPEPTQEETASVPVGDMSIFVSYDGGSSWAGLSTSAGLRPSVFEFKKDDPSRFYVGTRGAGLWLLDSDGKTLKRVEDRKGVLKTNADIYGIAQSGTGDSLYLALFQDNVGRLIRLREDESEELFRSPLERYGVFGVAVSQENDRRIIIASAASGILESVDEGKTWETISRIRDGVLRFIQDPSVEGKIFAIGNDKKLYVTQTWGRLWTERPAFSLKDSGSVGVLHDFVLSKTRGSIFAGTDYSVIESADDAMTWHTFSALPITPRSIAITAVESHPRFPEVFWIAARNQIYRTDDGGITWSMTSLPVEGTVAFLRAEPDNPKTLYAGLSK